MTAPVLRVLISDGRTGNWGNVTASGSTWCNQTAAAVKATAEIWSTPSGGVWAAVASESELERDWHSATAIVTLSCPKGRWYHHAKSHGRAVTYQTEVDESPTRSSSVTETDCGHFAPIADPPSANP